MNDNELAIDDTPTIGHNLPSPLDLIRDDAEAVAKAANEWHVAVPQILDAETAQRSDDYLSQITKWITKVDHTRLAETQSLRDKVAAINATYRPLQELLQAAKNLINPKRTDWLQREQRRHNEEKRRQQEAAARIKFASDAAFKKALAHAGDIVGNMATAATLALQAQEAAEAAARPVERAQVRGSYSARASSLRTTWRAEVDSVRHCFDYYQNRSEIRELLTKLASAEAATAHREGRTIPGCRIIGEEKAV